MKINKGISLCVFGGKGGTGKSTLCLNLAGVYSLLNKRVLIIDFDLTGGSIALHLNKKVSKTLYNLVDDYNNNRYDNISNYVTKYNENIDYLSAPKDPRQALKIDTKYVNIIIDRAVFQYDVVLIDMNHSLNATNLAILDKVDKILFNVTNDMYDLKNIRSLLSIFEDLQIQKYKVILNESVNSHKKMYSIYDIKSIIKTNIDYKLSNRAFLKNIDDYVINGCIPSLEKEFRKNKKDFDVLNLIATLSLEESDKNE